MRTGPGAILIVVGLLVAACGTDMDDEPAAVKTSIAPSPTSANSSKSATPSPSSTPTPPARTGTVVIAADSKYGQMLYDATGQPIYLFDDETTKTPTCYGECAEAWPPVLTKGLPQARAAVKEKLLGTTKRKNGSLQVTYAGHPLYFYAHEGKYQVLCHNIVEYGGTWLVVRPDGRPAPG